MKEYKTEAAAKAAVGELTGEGPKQICPLLRGLCDARCLCYTPPTFSAPRDGIFYVYNGGCDNLMFFGSGI